MESSKLPKVGLALTIFAVIFQVIGLASPYWFAQNTDLGVIKLKIHAGLWKCCKGTDDNIKCDDIDDCLQEGSSREYFQYTCITFTPYI